MEQPGAGSVIPAASVDVGGLLGTGGARLDAPLAGCEKSLFLPCHPVSSRRRQKTGQKIAQNQTFLADLQAVLAGGPGARSGTPDSVVARPDRCFWT